MNSRASKTLTFAGLICAMVLLYCIYHISKFNSINPRDINHIAAEAGDLQNDTGDETKKEYGDSFDYQAAMDELNKENVAQDDQRLIRLIRDFYIDPPSDLPYNLKNLDRQDYSKGQTPFVDSRLNYMEQGFFVECGAFTGEDRSNTLFFEKTRKWTGLLIEADPDLYAKVRSKHRKSFTVNACLSPEPYPALLNFNLHGHMGRVVNNGEARAWIKQNGIRAKERPTQCFPLYSLLLALNQTRVDFLSLDIEGDELHVLKTIPFDKVDIRMMTVEFAHDKGGDSSIKNFLNTKEYDSLIKLQRWDAFANDIIARKREHPH